MTVETLPPLDPMAWYAVVSEFPCRKEEKRRVRGKLTRRPFLSFLRARSEGEATNLTDSVDSSLEIVLGLVFDLLAKVRLFELRQRRREGIAKSETAIPFARPFPALLTS